MVFFRVDFGQQKDSVSRKKHFVSQKKLLPKKVFCITQKVFCLSKNKHLRGTLYPKKKHFALPKKWHPEWPRTSWCETWISGRPTCTMGGSKLWRTGCFFFGGVQLVVDTTLVSPVHCDGTARRHTATSDSVRCSWGGAEGRS